MKAGSLHPIRADSVETGMVCGFPYAALLWRAASLHSWFWLYLKICHVPGENLSLTAITIHQGTPEELKYLKEASTDERESYRVKSP